MKTMLVYTENYLNDVINEETGEVITPAHTEKLLTPYELDKVVKVKMGWNALEVMLASGDITKYDNVEEIYFR